MTSGEDPAGSPPRPRAAAETLWPAYGGGEDRPALIQAHDGASFSYRELSEMVNGLALSVAGAGIEPGDVVAFSLPNCCEFIVLFYGVVAARAVAAPLNPAYTREEFAAYLADLRPRAMFFYGAEPRSARQACRDLGIDTWEVETAAPGRLTVAGGASRATVRRPEPDDIALLLHTSGTTSRPKSVPLRHRNLAASALAIGGGYGLGAGDVSYCVMPLFHVHGLVGSTLAMLAAGGSVVVPRRFSARAFWRDVAEFGATWFSAVPTMHHVLVSRPDERRRGDSLRFARSCSSALPTVLQDSFESRFAMPLVQAYGMTEAAHQMATNPLPPDERRAGTVGCAAGAEVAIVDDAWRPVPAAQTGEVVVRGRGVVNGYVNAPEATASSFRDGWFRTGDSGSLSADGYLHLAGRIKEIINRGGEKISPHEIEEVLLGHPTVSEAVAFALPDEKFGEVVGAVVVGRDADPAALRRHCAESLAGFKVPTRVVVLDSVPKGSTGKVQRRLLAEQIDR